MDRQQTKFSLIELLLILVIIGLIVGSVLAARDIINAAESQAAVGRGR
jgi:Tfp pilus assembly protein FimT